MENGDYIRKASPSRNEGADFSDIYGAAYGSEKIKQAGGDGMNSGATMEREKVAIKEPKNWFNGADKTGYELPSDVQAKIQNQMKNTWRETQK